MSENQLASTRRDLVEQNILERAVKLFAEQGYGATTLQDIATAVGVSRPTLYYYFNTKEALLDRLVSEVTAAGAASLREISARQLPPMKTLAEAVGAMLRRRLADPLSFRALDRCEPDLAEEALQAHRSSKRTVLRLLTQSIEEAQAVGLARPMDPRTAALGIIGMCNWVAWWYVPVDDPEPVAQQLTEMALAAIASSHSADDKGQTPRQVVQRLRNELDILDRMV